MRYIYREQHTVLVDYEIDLDDEQLIESGINPHNDLEVAEYIKDFHLDLNPESTEWWISAQLNNATKIVGTRPYNDDSEESIKWIV
jgi:hypothetical protein